MDTSNFLVTNIVQNIVFCVQQMKENHTGLEHEGEQIIFTEGPFLGELCLYLSSKTKDVKTILKYCFKTSNPSDN